MAELGDGVPMPVKPLLSLVRTNHITLFACTNVDDVLTGTSEPSPDQELLPTVAGPFRLYDHPWPVQPILATRAF